MLDIILIGIIPWFWLDTKEYRRDINIVINVWIDDLTPCLKDIETGDFVATEVVRIRRKSKALLWSF